MNVSVQLAQDTPAYAYTIVDVPDGLSGSALRDAIISRLESRADDFVFKPSWDFRGYRIVNAKTSDDAFVDHLEDVPLEVSAWDIGIVTQQALRDGRLDRIVTEYLRQDRGEDGPAVRRRAVLAVPGRPALRCEFVAPRDAPDGVLRLLALEALTANGRNITIERVTHTSTEVTA